jgi:hypothetical protein
MIKAIVAVVLLVVVGAIASLLAGCSMGTPTAAKEEASPPTTTAQGDTPTSASDEKAEEVQPGPVGGNAPESPPDLSPAPPPPAPPPSPGDAPEGSDGQLKEDADQDGLSAPSSVGAPPTESPAPSTPDSGTNDTEGKAVPVCPGPAAPGTARCHSQVLVR